jgi:hypothetical protein
MIMRRNAWQFQMAIAFALVLLVSPCNAQKKGGGGASGSSSSGANPAPTTASNAPFEVEMLSYGALDKIDERLSDYACTLKPRSGAGQFSSVVVLDPPALLALQAYDAFTVNARALASTFAAMQGRAGAGAGFDDFSDITNAVVAAAVSSTTESSFSFTVQDPTAAIVLLNHLKSHNKSDICKAAYYAGVYAVNEASKPKFHSQEIGSVSEELDGLASLRTSTLKAIMTAGEATSAAARNAAGCAPIPSAASVISVGGASLYPFGGQDPCLTAFNNLDNSYNIFLQGLSTPNATTGQPALSSILQGFRTRALFASATVEKPILGIYLSISAAGGTQQVRKNLLTALFTGDWIRYSGGVSVNVIVFEIANGDTAKDDKSQVLLSDLIRYRTPLGHIKKPGNYDGSPEAGDNLGKIPANP